MSVDSVWVKNGIYQFIVTEEDKIRQLQTIRESNRILERIALYILSQMPDWKPAKRRGENAACSFTVPINWKDIFLDLLVYANAVAAVSCTNNSIKNNILRIVLPQ